MKYVFTVCCLIEIIAFVSCGAIREDVKVEYGSKKNEVPIDESILQPSLLNKLSEVITYKDSLAAISTTYSKHNSIWIHFYEQKNKCYVVVMSNFSFYNSLEMDGYFRHRNKVVTVYDSKTACGKELIRTDKLTTGKISSLIDYESDELIWPHEPYSREYLIVNKDSLILTFQGYR